MKKNLVVLVSSLLILVLSTSTNLSCFASSDDSTNNPAVDAVTNDDDITVTDATYDPSAADPSQYDVYSPSSITPLPGGGESINFIINGVVNSYLVPPNNFNPKKATNEQLAEYGLPLRPSDPALLKDWEKEIKNFKHAVKPLRAYVKKNTVNTTASQPNWAGIVDCINPNHVTSGATFSEGLFQYVSGSWTQPTMTGQSSSYQESTWIGIGGDGKCGLIQCGTAYNFSSGYQVWYEYLPADISKGSGRLPFYANSVPISVAPGNNIQASVSCTGGNATYTISVNGQYASAVAYISADCYYGGTAEWIVERPSDIYGNYNTLASFNKVDFTGCSTYTNLTSNGSSTGVAFPMNAYSEIQISMYGDDLKTVAYPSNITANGFSVIHG